MRTESQLTGNKCVATRDHNRSRESFPCIAVLFYTHDWKTRHEFELETD